MKLKFKKNTDDIILFGLSLGFTVVSAFGLIQAIAKTLFSVVLIGNH